MVYCSHLKIVVRLLSVTLLFVVYSKLESFRIPYSFSLKKTQASNKTQVLTHSALSQKLAEQSFFVDREIPTKLCPFVSPKLIGWTNLSLPMVKSLLEEDENTVKMKMKNAYLKIGGRYEPNECRSRHKVAIVVPYRDRKDHLTVFLRYLHPFLQRQQLNYVIIVVEQSAGLPFNRGMLMNIGFKEAQLQEKFQCFIFHDVDFLPEDDSNPYTCPEDEMPRQMSFSIDYWDNYRPTPASYLGGVTALSATDFHRVNGFSNSFWGWGGEDDQMYQRIKFNNLTVVRAFDDQPSLVFKARYKTLSHQKARPNPDRKRVLDEGNARFKTDGLVNLEYERLILEFKPLYTHIIVDIEQSIKGSHQ